MRVMMALARRIVVMVRGAVLPPARPTRCEPILGCAPATWAGRRCWRLSGPGLLRQGACLARRQHRGPRGRDRVADRAQRRRQSTTLKALIGLLTVAGGGRRLLDRAGRDHQAAPDEPPRRGLRCPMQSLPQPDRARNLAMGQVAHARILDRAACQDPVPGAARTPPRPPATHPLSGGEQQMPGDRARAAGNPACCCSTGRRRPGAAGGHRRARCHRGDQPPGRAHPARGQNLRACRSRSRTASTSSTTDRSSPAGQRHRAARRPPASSRATSGSDARIAVSPSSLPNPPGPHAAEDLVPIRRRFRPPSRLPGRRDTPLPVASPGTTVSLHGTNKKFNRGLIVDDCISSPGRTR